MSSILRSVAAVVLGVITCTLVILGVQYLGHQLYPMPTGVDINDPQALADMAASMPMGAKAIVVVAWCIGAFCGSWVACLIKPRWRKVAVVAVSGMVVLGTILNAVNIPTDFWMLAIGLLAPIPLGLLAERISR
jgi:dienelactone hydrolase